MTLPCLADCTWKDCPDECNYNDCEVNVVSCNTPKNVNGIMVTILPEVGTDWVILEEKIVRLGPLDTGESTSFEGKEIKLLEKNVYDISVDIDGEQCVIQYDKDQSSTLCNDYELYYTKNNAGVPMDQIKIYLHVIPKKPQETKINLRETTEFNSKDLTLAYIDRFELAECKGQAHFIKDPNCIRFCYPVANDGECGHDEVNFDKRDCIDCNDGECGDHDYHYCPEDCIDCDDGECHWWEKEYCIDECTDEASGDDICQSYEVGIDEDCGETSLDVIGKDIFLKNEEKYDFFGPYELEVESITEAHNYNKYISANFNLYVSGRVSESFTLKLMEWKIIDDHLLYMAGQPALDVIKVHHLKVTELSNPLELNKYEGFIINDRFHFLSEAKDINKIPILDFNELAHGYRYSFSYIINGRFLKDKNITYSESKNQYIEVLKHDDNSITIQFSDNFFECGNADGACPDGCSNSEDLDCERSNQITDNIANISVIETNPIQPLHANCSDGIQNQDETGIDMGGNCPPWHLCDIDDDCIDRNPCTNDVCTGNPRQCSNIATDGCSLNDKCIPIGMRIENRFCNQKDGMQDQLTDGDKCNNNYECVNNSCVDNACTNQGVFKRVLNWFTNLFG